MSATASFYINDWLVEPNYNKLSRGKVSHQLEPLVMDVLVFFAENANEVISRDQLVAAVWQGRIVGDHAIYRIINQLRKFLDENEEQKYFVTIRKKGYRFIAPVTKKEVPSKVGSEQSVGAVTSKQGAEQSQRNVSLPLKRLSTGLIAVLVITVGVVLLMQRSNTSVPDFSKVTPVTNLPGEERNPAFSFDGDKIAFSYKAAGSKSSHIYYQSLQDHSLVQVTSGDVTDVLPKWSPNDKKLAFVRYQKNNCEILIKDLSQLNSPAVSALTCNGYGRLIDFVWSNDGSDIFYTDSPSAIEPLRVYRRSLVTGKQTQLTNPQSGKAMGDLKLALSPDSQYLAIIRDYNWGDTNVFLLDLNSGEEERLFSISGWQLALSWSHDGKYLYYSNEKNTVDAFSIKRKRSKVVAKNIEPISFPVSSPTAAKIAVETGQSAIDIWQLDLGYSQAENKQPFIVSSEFDLYPTYANTSYRSAFISSRSGNLQVWIREEDGKEFQLTRFADGRPIRRIRWSPDDRYLLSDRSKYLYLVDAKTGEETRLMTKAHWPLAETSSWSRDGKSIYFSSDADGDWQIYKMAARKNAPIEKITHSGGYSAEESLDGQSIYYLKYHKPGLWQLSFETGQEKKVINDIDVFSNDAWKVTKEGIYYFNNNDKASGIYLVNYEQLQNDPEQQAKALQLRLPPLMKNFSLAYDQSKLIYPKFFQSESSIVLLEPKHTQTF